MGPQLTGMRHGDAVKLNDLSGLKLRPDGVIRTFFREIPCQGIYHPIADDEGVTRLQAQQISRKIAIAEAMQDGVTDGPGMWKC